MTASSLSVSTRLRQRNNCEQWWIILMILSLRRKMKAKFQSGPVGHAFSSLPCVSEHLLLWGPMLMSKQVCGAHCYWVCLYQLSYFLGSQTHGYLRKHGSSSFSFLYSAPVTFLSEAFKKKKKKNNTHTHKKNPAVTVAQKRQSLTSGLAIGE